MWLALIGAFYLGWSLGANGGAHVFSTAVSSGVLKYKTAVILASIFVILGALLEGYEGINTLSGLTTQDVNTATIITIAAAFSVSIMTFLKLPASTSQAVVGSIIGIGILNSDVDISRFTKVIICWIGTPVGGFIVAILTYILLSKLYNMIGPGVVAHDIILKIGLIIAGCYGAYALGANNVANVVGVLVGARILTPLLAVSIGSVSIALGILTFSKGVMHTIGKGIVRLDGFSALVVVIAEAITVHIYAMVGVPVSVSQAVVGAVLGVGILKRIEAVSIRPIIGIFMGWLFTPVISAMIVILIYVILHLKYTG